MGIFATIENKVVHHFVKSRNLMDRFIKLPWYVKMLISPLALILFFTLVFPVIIIFGIIYKLLSILSKAFKEIFSNWKLVLISLLFFVSSIAIIFISTIVFALFLNIYIAVIPILPNIILRLISFIVAPYFLLLFFLDGNTTLKNLKASIQAISESDFSLEEEKKIIREASGNKTSLNPLLWLIKSPFTLMATASLTFISALFVIVLISVTINSAFPGVFFNSDEGSLNQLHFWLLYIFDQMLIIIPIDLMGPFLPDNSEKLVQQPWGGLLSILFQLFLAYMTYLYLNTIVGSAKYYIQKKMIKKNLL